LSIFILIMVLAGCTNTPTTTKVEPLNDGAHVIYFHGKQRCATCNSIEQGVGEVVAALGDSVATFTVVDISTDAGAAMAEQYRVASSALIVCRWERGSMAESVDLTTMAFAHARSNPKQFKQLLTHEITKIKH
ncbi:MAG: nitrophenyl compound nitroreductase subunit ArsF family protein, partial [Muribaculaceae bacterium]